MDDLRRPLRAVSRLDNAAAKPLVLINHLVEPPGKITGITRYALGLIEALALRGNCRLVLATGFSAAQLPAAIVDNAERIVTLPHIASTPLSYFRQRKQLLALAREIRPDAVYAMNPMCPPVPGVPSIVTVHDLYMEVMPELYARRHRLWWKLFFPLAASSSARTVCVSKNSAADAVRLHPRLRDNISIVPGAPVLPKFELELPASPSFAPDGLLEEPYVLALGNVTPNKNLGFLAAALQRLAQAGTPLKVVHVGRDLCGELASAIEKSQGQLVTLGGLDDRQLDHIMRNAAALVQPSRYEGFGLPILEAHDRALPVIASDIAIFREIGGEGCVYVPLGDARALAGALFQAVHDRTWRSIWSARAAANARRFGWDRSAAAAENMLADLLETRRNG